MNDVIVSTEREDITQDDLLTTVNSLDELLECHSVTYNNNILKIEDIKLDFEINQSFYDNIKEKYPEIKKLDHYGCTFSHKLIVKYFIIEYSLNFNDTTFENEVDFSNTHRFWNIPNYYSL